MNAEISIALYLLAAYMLAITFYADGASGWRSIAIAIIWPVFGVWLVLCNAVYAINAASGWLMERIGAD